MDDGMFDAQVSRKDRHTLIVCKGRFDLHVFKKLVDGIADGTYGAGGPPRFLVDLRFISGEMSMIERFELGRYIAERIPHLKLAAVSRREHQNKVGENVAVNRGASVFSTDDIGLAEEWIDSEA
jgi:hypothetical protein